MSSAAPPPPPGPPGGPPHRQQTPPPYPPVPPREGKPVSFFVAIFLGLLLVVSGGLNLLLLAVTFFGAAASVPTTLAEEDQMRYRVVTVGGDKDAPTRILRVLVEGAISEAPSVMIGAEGGTVSQIRRNLELAGRDDSIKAVLIDIDSPGGGVTDSDTIHRMIRDFRQEHPDIPVLALFGDISASGGYYIAVACDRILARPTTITGSIGVIMSSYDLTEAAAKLGIDSVVIKSGPHKDMMSPLRPLEPAEREILQSIVDEMYQRFVDVVDQGRPDLDRARVAELADGRIFSAGQAMENGLVDGVATREEAHDWLVGQIGVDRAAVVEQRRIPGLAEMLFGVRGPEPPSLESSAATLLKGRSGPRLLYYWLGAR